MATHKWIDRICIIAVVLALLITLLFMNGTALGIQSIARSMGYEDRLFDTSYVHTIDIVMDDWESFIETCENEEYAACTVVIDGERYTNVGIRAKGNTSLSSVSSMGSDRYSFKIEFDQYDSTKSYYGLDKLSLNNLIQDNTLMKDYLVYQMMDMASAASSLCSYAYITVNGADWGLYLAVEAIEDSFLQRNYGSDYGELYKPDTTMNGGGRGNGKDFDMNNWSADDADTTDTTQTQQQFPTRGQGGKTMSEGFDPSAMEDQMPQMGGEITMPEDFDPSAMEGQLPESFDPSAMEEQKGGMMGSGMGSSDIKLQYIDDDPESYANIFDNAKTDITDADETRLIEALQKLSAGEDISDTVDVEAVIRYFVAHTFVCNDDSYTGTMIHNYYLYEKDGTLSMLPWDYNLAFGGFQGGSASSVVNSSIDSPVSGGDVTDRPMLAWIFASEEYTALYHQYYQEFVDTYLESGIASQLIADTAALIAPYVEKDPSKFCTYEEFETGVDALQQFISLRTESVSRQLAGDTTAVDTGDLNLSDMGSMGNTMGGMDRSGDTGTFPSKAQWGEIPEMPGGSFQPPQ